MTGACHDDHASLTTEPAPISEPTPRIAGMVRAAPIGWIGVVVPSASTDLSAARAGRLESVDVRQGDTVVSGQRLARLDTRSIDQEVRMAEAEVAVARAEHARATADADREAQRHQRRLAAADVVSREEQEAAGADARAAAAMRDAAEAQVVQRQARLEDLRERRAETELRAPFAGRIAIRYLDAGATVSEGMPIVRLVRDDALTVRFAVPPEELGTLSKGMSVSVRDAENRPVATATVMQIAPELDIPSQMVFVGAVPEAEAEASRQGTADPLALRAGGGVWVVPISPAPISPTEVAKGGP